MKLWEVLRFEVVYRLRSPATWVYLGLVVALTFLMGRSYIADAERNGHLLADAPWGMAVGSVIVSMIGALVTAALAGDAATRDVEFRMRPLFFTTPLGKAEYLGGRFLGILAVNAFLLSAVPIGLLLTTRMTSVEAELLGPFQLGTYLRPYLFIVLPNLFVTASILFALAALSRRSLSSYGGGLLLFLSSLLCEEFLAEQTVWRKLAAVLDPFGFTTLSEISAYWTPVEQNTEVLRLEGLLLWNRVVWVACAAGVFTFLYSRFRLALDGERRRQRGGASKPASAEQEGGAVVAVPYVAPAFGTTVRMRQVVAVARRSFGEIIANRFLLGVFAVSYVFLFGTGWNIGFVLDTPTWPVTSVIAVRLLGTLSFLVYVLVALYAGDLVWMDRSVRASGITDALPVPSWVQLAGKFAALVAFLAVLQAVLMTGGVLMQAAKGYSTFELGLYVRILFGLQLADYVLVAALAFFVHVIVGHKHVGSLLVLLYCLFVRFAPRFGIEHKLLLYGADPGWSHSDLSGFEPFLAPYLWFKLHWAAWAVLFAVVAHLFWVRGAEGGWRHRLRRARGRWTQPVAMSAAVAGVVVLFTGGFVFYNTNILNDYRSRDERIDRQVEYERRYKQYEELPQPLLTRSSLRIEIYPQKRGAELRGIYHLENRSHEPIDSVHVFLDFEVEARTLGFDRDAVPVLEDEEHGYRVFALEEALQPGEALRLDFDLALESHGFPNHGISTAVLGNGSFLRRGLLPIIGYQPDFELLDEGTREEHALAPRKRLAPIDHLPARRFGFSLRDAEWVELETVIGTAPDQIAVAPGSLRRTWTENGRRYFHYATDAPIPNHYSIFSARYAVREESWNDVEVRIFHHPEHSFNLDSMMRGIHAALDYHTEHFGPYPHRQLRIVEFPRHEGTFAWSFPNTIAYSEGFGFIARTEDGIDYPFLVTAHEVAHQWWGNQLVTARVEGGPILETLAHYGALMVMEETYGRDQAQRFLGLLSDRYLRGRQNYAGREVPLMLSNDQKHIHYDKGALVMYTLREYIGEERVNTALRRFFEANRFGEAPFPTTLDLLAELEAVTPDSMRYLLTDLFEEITLWDLRAREARAEPIGTGAYRVTLEVEALKLGPDEFGLETEVPMDDLVEIGVFAAAQDGGRLGEALYLEKHRVRSGQQTVAVTVPGEPARAAVDPYHRLIDRRMDDNTVAVEVLDRFQGDP